MDESIRSPGVDPFRNFDGFNARHFRHPIWTHRCARCFARSRNSQHAVTGLGMLSRYGNEVTSPEYLIGIKKQLAACPKKFISALLFR